MHGKQCVLAVVATLGILAVVGCSSSSPSSSTSGPPANSSASASTPIASSSAVAAAKQQATACLQRTGTAGLLTSSGRSQLITCVENIVPPAERGAFKNCMASAAVSDQVWTKAGRDKFTGTSLVACLNTAAGATPSAALRHGRAQRGRTQPGGRVVPQRP
jgi:hypothetical protein